MRRFEPRGKEAPMEFTYERDEREREFGGGWNPLRATFQQPKTTQNTPVSGSSSAFSSLAASTSFTPQRTAYVASAFTPPGAFLSQPGRESSLPPEPNDVSMSSDQPSPQKEQPAASNESDRESPSKPKKTRGTLGAKLMRRFIGKSSKGKERENDIDDDDDVFSSPSKGRRRRASDASDADDEDSYYPHGPTSHVYNVNFGHPKPTGGTPRELTDYAKFFFTATGLFFVLYLSYNFLMMVRDDVNAKVTEYSSEIFHEIQSCSQQYFTNQCHPDTRLPALRVVCQEWERCMNKDPKVVSRVRVWAETLGEMFNSFVEPITWKALAFVVITLVSISFATWGLLRLFGAWQHPPTHPAPEHTPSFQMLPPSTPSRSLSGPGLVEGRAGSPFVVREWSQGPVVPQTPRRRSKA